MQVLAGKVLLRHLPFGPVGAVLGHGLYPLKARQHGQL